jgi:hypothetical protein
MAATILQETVTFRCRRRESLSRPLCASRPWRTSRQWVTARPCDADGEAAPDDTSVNEAADVTSPDVKEGELGDDPQLDRAFELLRSGQVVKTLAKRDE